MIMGGSRHTKNRNAIEIELTYEDVELIHNLVEEESFVEHILTETYDSISYAVEHSLTQIDLFNIVNLGYNISIQKEDYVSVLRVILKMYEKKEDYLECATVKNLIQFIENE
jgi:hypothetical protein